MAIEMQLHLVSISRVEELVAMPWVEVLLSMEKTHLRNIRPAIDSELLRGFDIDNEAEILDWSDKHKLSDTTTVLQTIHNSWENGIMTLKEACEGLLHFIKWASIGYWKALEGRAYLYLEPLMNVDSLSIQDLYEDEIWQQVRKELPSIVEKEYCEKVVLAWMKMRKEMNETLDEKSDPRILSTMQSHMRLSGQLHHIVSRWLEDDDLRLIIGGEHISFENWTFENVPFHQIITHGLP